MKRPLLYGALALMPLVATAKPFKDGDVVVFFGDSITHGGLYHEYITDYYRTRFPEADIRFINSGIGGDTASGAMPRIPVDVAEYNPTHVAYHFGMNDVSRGSYTYTPTSASLQRAEAAQVRYRENMAALVAKVKEAVPGAKSIYFTPTPYDDTAVITNIPPGATGWTTVNQQGCNTGLALMSGFILAKAKKDGAMGVDWFSTLQNYIMDHRKGNPYFKLTGYDRVHPRALGHSLMAWKFLKDQGVPAVVSDVAVDAASGQATRSNNATVSEIARTGGGIAFTLLAKSLPFPIPAEAQDAARELGIEDALNRETLAVAGLAPGSYTLKIDGAEIGEWTSEEWAQGVHLGFNAKTPQYAQARKVFDETARLSASERILRGYHSARWYYGRRAPVDDVKAFAAWFEKNEPKKDGGFAQRVPGYCKYWPTYRQTREQLRADQEKARELGRPKAHRYEITRR